MDSKKNLHAVIFLLLFNLLLFLPSVTLEGAQDTIKTDIERVDLFELVYAYNAADVSHSGISSHGPHWVRWRNDTIFSLIDTAENSWVQSSPDKEFTVDISLKAPVCVHQVSLTSMALHRTDEYAPVRWLIHRTDEQGKALEIISDSMIKEPGKDKIELNKPATLQRFRLTAFPVGEDGKPLEKSKMAVRFNDFSLYAEREVAFLAVAPAPHITFDMEFYPYIVLKGSTFRMRAWKIYSTGQSFEDTADVRWFSSNRNVAVVSDDGVIRVTGEGDALITGALSREISFSVPIRAILDSAGYVDLSIIYIDRWIRDKQGNLIKRDWGEEIDLPQPGEKLVFRAHMINSGLKTASGIRARWWINGNPHGQKILGSLTHAGGLVPSGKTIDVKKKDTDGKNVIEHSVPLLKHEHEAWFDFLEIPYDGRRYEITLEILPAGDTDRNPHNNRLTIWSDAITFGYYMSETTYFAYSLIQKYGWENLPEDFKPPHEKTEWGLDEWAMKSSNAYDRFQRIVRVFNRQFAMSVHQLTPQGITERLNGIMHIVPDPENDNVFGINCHRFGASNRTIDVIWGLLRSKDKSIASYTYERMIDLFRKGSYPYIDTPLIHEVSHARYLIDLYGGGIQKKEIHILDEKGERVFQDNNEEVYNRKLRFERKDSGRGMMVGGMGYENGWSEHGAYSWERIRGRRARAGTWNASPELGEFLNTIPDSNIIKVTTPDGRPLSGARIDVYQSVHGPWHGEGGGIYSKNVDNTVDISVVTNQNGEAELGPTPFTNLEGKEPEKLRWHPKGVYGYNGEANAIIKITYRGRSYYKVLTVFDSNLGYWHKYGLKVDTWPEVRVRPDSKLTYHYTVDPSWSAEQEKENRVEIPKTF